MISAASWIPQGFARSSPLKVELSEEQAKEYIESSNLNLSIAREALFHAEHSKETKAFNTDDTQSFKVENDNLTLIQESTINDDDIMKKYGLYDYDSKDKQNEDIVERIFTTMENMRMDDDDNYQLLDAEEEDEAEDWIIKPTDHLLVAVRAPEDQDDLAQLEYYIYEEEEDNLFVHHDVLLPSYPLCLEWIGADAKPNDYNFKNFVAIGTFEPDIEIWNMDLLDPIHPHIILGQEEKHKSKAATMCLAWNSNHSRLLASGSSDSSICLWDISESQYPVCSFDRHKDKVQSIAWSKDTPTVLASAGFDKRLWVFDTRAPKDGLCYKLDGEAELVKWDPYHPHCLAVADDQGVVSYIDIRQLSKKSSHSKSIFSLQSHLKATTCLDFNPKIPSLLMTASLDKTIKLWDLTPEGPMQILTKPSPGLGKLFSASFAKNSPFLLAISGATDDMVVWNLLQATTTAHPDAELLALRDLMESRLSFQ